MKFTISATLINSKILEQNSSFLQAGWAELLHVDLGQGATKNFRLDFFDTLMTLPNQGPGTQ